MIRSAVESGEGPFNNGRVKVNQQWPVVRGAVCVETEQGSDLVLNLKRTPKKCRALIIDDSAMCRRLARNVLEGMNVEVVGEAADGVDGILLARELKPDLIMMDVYMKAVGGIEAARKISELLPGAHIVIMTNTPSPSLVVEAISAGASNFVIKPLKPQALRGIVRRFDR